MWRERAGLPKVLQICWIMAQGVTKEWDVDLQQECQA